MPTATTKLLSLHDALTVALPLAGAKQLADGPTGLELALEARFALALQGPLRSTYTFALAGIEEVEDEDEETILAWIAARFRETPEAAAALAAVLFTYGRRGFDLGGAMGLEAMGISRPFRLTNQALIDALRAYADSLVDIDADISLTRTTAQETARRFRLLRDGGLVTGAAIAAFVAYGIARALSRSAVTAETESVRLTRRAMLETYRRNEVTTYIYHTQGDKLVCRFCLPYSGRRYDEADWGVVQTLIPQHTGCRCWFQPLVELVPDEVWTGE
jgi:hypothetical protein